MPLHSRDVQKLLRAGIVIIRADNNGLKIKRKTNASPEWKTFQKGFESKAAVRRQMDELLKLNTIIED